MGRGGSTTSLWFKAVFGCLLVVLGFLLVLVVGALQISEGKQTRTTLTSYKYSSSSSSSTGKHHPQQLDLNYMSKRRVPNGPDPIHNRRAGNSKRPPGQA